MVTLVYVAGGKGTRLNPVNSGRPKCLTSIAGHPVLQHQLDWAERFGVKQFVFLLGHLGEQIQEFVSASRFARNSKFYIERETLGTAGCFHQLDKQIAGTLLVLYGDVLCNFDLDRFLAFHKRKNADASLFLHSNDHPYDSDLVELDEQEKITEIHRKPHPERMIFANLVNAAVYLLEPKLLRHLPPGQSDWMHDVFPSLLRNKVSIYGYRSSEYIKDMGTPKRLLEAEHDFFTGKAQHGSYIHNRTAIFLAWNEAISNRSNEIHRTESPALSPHAGQLIRRINRSGFVTIVTAGRPLFRWDPLLKNELVQTHKIIETALSKQCAYLDGLYFCSNHTAKSFHSESCESQIKWDGQSNDVGLIRKAAQDHCLDLSQSWLIGSTMNDVQAGHQAGMRTVLVQANSDSFTTKASASFFFFKKDLTHAVDFILALEGKE